MAGWPVLAISTRLRHEGVPRRQRPIRDLARACATTSTTSSCRPALPSPLLSVAGPGGVAGFQRVVMTTY